MTDPINQAHSLENECLEAVKILKATGDEIPDWLGDVVARKMYLPHRKVF